MDSATALPKDMWDKIVETLPPPQPRLSHVFFIKFTVDCRDKYAVIFPSRAISPEELALIRWFEGHDLKTGSHYGLASSATTFNGKRSDRDFFADRFLKDAVMLGYDFMSPADRATWVDKINKDEECEFFMIKRLS